MTGHGILWAIELNGQGGGRLLSWEELLGLAPEGPPVWLHLESASPELRAWLLTSCALDAAALDSLFAEETRPRCLRLQDALLVFLRGVNLTPGSEPDDMLSLRLVVRGRLLVSYRQERMETTQAVRTRFEADRGPKTLTELLVALAAELTSRIEPVLENLDELADSLELELETRPAARDRAALANLRQQTIALRRYLAPQRLALTSLLADPPEWLDRAGVARLREVGDVTLRFVEDLDELRERTTVIHDELSNRVAEELNSRMYVLSVVTLVFLPLGLLTGLLGINVGGMPGAENPAAFWIVCGILVAISIGIGAWLRFARWV